MPRKTKRSRLHRLFRHSSVLAVVVVVLFVGLGAVMVPGIFAETGTPSITNVEATPGGGRNYGVTVTWDGWTRDHWKGETLLGGTVVSRWTTNAKQYGTTGLSCGALYTFRVAAAGPGGGAQSDWKSDTARPTCPTANWVKYGIVGNRVDMDWKDGSGFSERYLVDVSVNNGPYTTFITTTATNYSFMGNCGTLYSTVIRANANGQTGPATGVQSLATPPCPPPPSGGTSSGGGTAAGSSSGGSVSGGSSNSSSASSSTVKRLPITNGTAKPLTPSTPENFSADVASHKIVVLSWDPSTNVDHYVISRSTDASAWREIATTTQTSYNDEGADFSTTYYYQLQAVSVSGQKSGAATAQVTTEAFEESSNTISSQDKLVTAKVPDGAIEGDYSCTIGTTDTEGSDLPKGQKLVLGPYDLLCVAQAGDVIAGFKKPVQLTMKLASVAEGYQNVTARILKSGSWQAAKSDFNQQEQQISFTMTSSSSFAAFGEKHKSVWSTIITIFLIMLAVAAAVAGLLWWRRRTPLQHRTARSEAAAEREFRQALSQPDCSHLNMAQQVMPSGVGCYECEQQHTHWNALRICLLCGHVGCSDDSPEQHAFKHFQETGHPLIYEYGNPNGNTIGWCYIDQTYI